MNYREVMAALLLALEVAAWYHPECQLVNQLVLPRAPLHLLPIAMVGSREPSDVGMAQGSSAR